MASRNRTLAFALNLAGLGIGLTGTAWSLATPGSRLVTPMLALVVIAFAVRFWRAATHSDRMLAEFLDSLRYADFSRRIPIDGQGGAYATLATSMNALMEKFRDFRVEQERTIRYQRAVIEHVPVPLIRLDPEQRIRPVNNAARRFLGAWVAGSLDELAAAAPTLVAAIRGLKVGNQQLVDVGGEDGEVRRIAVTATDIVVAGCNTRLVALQDIAGAIASAQFQAWEQLVRVLTHEIMNSLTPVASLSHSAADVLESLDDETVPAEPLAEARRATETVARRADALMRFVERYRQLARLPAPKRRKTVIADLFAHVTRIMGADIHAAGIELETSLAQPKLAFVADPDQVEQVLINLLRNALEALHGQAQGRIRLGARISRQGRTVITMADNGPGVAGELRDDIFVPFFTTRKSGSGIGLALARQIMVAHRGDIICRDAEHGGAEFLLSFP